MNVEVTIFTPTYNRRNEIMALYNSLKQQTCKKFEWLVVDDGSNDNTSGLFEELVEKTQEFSIRYYYKENGGKHRAINHGLDRANGRLFFIVDSDDYLTNDAIEIILTEELKIRNDIMKLAGLGFNKGENKDEVVGASFTGDSIIASAIERQRYNIKGDKAEVYYTEILKQYKFPEFEGENFLTESVVWYKIADDGYKIKWINRIIYICKYLEDGLTNNSSKLALNNFVGYTYSIRQALNYNLTLIEKMILIGVYTRIARIKKHSFLEVSKNINQNILLCIMFGWLSVVSRKIKLIVTKKMRIL